MKLLRNIAGFAFAFIAVSAVAQEAPDALVKRVSQEVLGIIKSDPKVQAGDQARIREVVETKLLPNFDFERITALAMGRNWRQASPEQQKQLVDQAALDKYTFVRRSYLQRREYMVYDGKPPPEKED